MRELLRVIGAAAVLAASFVPAWSDTTIRVGHFPNITHVQAIVAHGLTRQGKGWFEPRVGSGVKIEWLVYNAGPSATEAIFANSLDLTYIGPSPALNAYARSRGDEIRVIAGAANGGAALVVAADSPLKSAADFKGRKIATPQLGNTQDVSARAWLTAGGLKVTMTGGDAQVIPTANPDQLTLFQQRQVDGVWTVEPWVSRLLAEGGGKILVEETDAITTVLVARAKYLAENRELVRKFAAAHAELTDWIAKNPAEAQRIVREELAAETRGDMAPALIASAWSRVKLTTDTSLDAFRALVATTQSVGFLRSAPDVGRIVERP